MEKTEPIDLERIRANDNSYIRKHLFNKHNQQLCASFITKNNGRPEDAEDVFLEAVTVFWMNVSNGRLTSLTSSVSTYLYGITRRLWLKKLKRSSRMIPSEQSEMEVTASMLALQLEIPGEEDCAEAMQKALEMLKQNNENHYHIVMLFYFEKKRMDEIAVRVGLKSADSAKNLRVTAMKKLAAYFEKMNVNREDCL